METVKLFEQFRDGDGDAAAALFQRFLERLVALAKRQLPSAVLRRVDEDDVAQSVFRTFFRRADDGQFDISKSGDLWKLLVSITLNKSRAIGRRERAQRRDVARDVRIAGSDDHAEDGIPAESLADPTAEDAVALVDEMHAIMAELSDRQRTIFEMRLQDAEKDEISKTVGIGRRSVNRELEIIREVIDARLGTGDRS